MIPEIKEKISTYLSRITPFGFSGTVLIASGNEILHIDGYGLADRTKGIKNTAHTSHDIGSITKQFTAAGILKLEMEGKLSTDSSITHYLKDVPESKKSITLHHLLTHTSGITDSSLDDYDVVTKDQAINRILSTPSNHINQFYYSNDGYTLLTAIIEEVSGLPYEEYIYTHLFHPANMEDTGYTIPHFQNENIANGYFNHQDCGKPTEKNYPYWNLMGNGGMLSTASDLYKWHCALLEDQILSREVKQKLFTPYLRDYAYGWRVASTAYGQVIEHGGASSYGTSAHFRRYIEKDMVILVLCNLFLENANQMAKMISDKLAKILFGEKVIVPPFLKMDETEHIENDYTHFQLETGGIFTLQSTEKNITLATYDLDCIQLFLGIEGNKEYMNQLSKKSLDITKDIIGGCYSSLEAVIENKQTFIERKNFIGNFLNGKSTVQEVQPIGAIPSTIIPETFEVRFRLHFEEETRDLLFFWKKDKIHFVGFAAKLGPITIDCVSNEGNYIGYSIEYESVISLKFPQTDMETIEFISPRNIANKIKMSVNSTI